MSSSSSDRNPVEVLADEFVARQRRGERPSLSEYTGRYPQYADEIRDLFPALVMMEQLKPAANDRSGPYQAGSGTRRHPERLGDYRILREVGRGGMGVVYEAEQVSLGRHVALKVLPASALLDAQRLQRFQREAKAAARLHHTNIVPVFGVGEADGLHFYVMQFITGLGLHEVLEELKRQRETRATSAPPAAGTAPAVSAAAVAQSLRTGIYAPPLDPAEDAPGQSPKDGVAVAAAPPAPALAQATPSGSSTLREEGGAYWQGVARIGLQAAEALAHAHVQGVLHRDVKPSNVLLDNAGNVWITDFGLAKMLADPEDLTQPGDIIGTLRYMAPERFNGRGDARSDVYSLGLTLYELLTLRPAFAATDRTQLIHKVLHEEPARPRSLNPKVPRDLETIVCKAMEREPSRRYATARELCDDLQRFLEDRPIKARPVGSVEQALKWARRRPEVATLLAAAAVLAMVAVGGIVYGLRQDLARQTDLTNQERENTQEQRRLAQEAQGERDKAEAILARSLLRPLGHQRGAPVNDIEWDALWELAEGPSDRVRLQFIERALAHPGTLRQLRYRQQEALHAAIGLDRSRRQRAGALLLARLRDERVDALMRGDGALVGVALGDPSPELAAASARALTDAMTKARNGDDLPYLAYGLVEVSARLGTEDAAAVARALTDAMTKESNSNALSCLAQGLVAVSARLGAEDAAAAARVLIDAIAKTLRSNPYTLSYLAQSWQAASARLGAEEAAKHAGAAARILTDALAKESTQYGLSYLAGGLVAVSARLGTEDAAAAARALTDKMAQTFIPSALSSLAQGLAAVSARLSAEDAAKYGGAAARVLTDALANDTDPNAVYPLTEGLQAVSARLGAEDAAAAARALTDAIAPTLRSTPNALYSLAVSLQAVSARMSPEAAAKHAGTAARALTDAMAQENNPNALLFLARGFGVVSALLSAEAAAEHAAAAAHTLIGAMAKENNPNALPSLAQGLVAVSARLGAEDAAAAARALTDKMAKTSNDQALPSLARGVGAVLARLSPEDAARYGGAAARALTDALPRTTDPLALVSLARGVGAVLARLSPEDAARYGGAAARALTDALSRTTDHRALVSLAQGLQEVSARLGAEDAAAAARAFTDKMAKTSDLVSLAQGLQEVSARPGAEDAAAAARAFTAAVAKTSDPDTLRHLAQGLWAVSEERLDSGEVGPRAVLLARGIGESMSPATRLSGLATLTQAAQPLPSRLSTQYMVDLLKMPTCVGPFRSVVLEMLGQRYHHRFADQWEFVEYAEKHLPNVDLKSPPRRATK
jgi:serine/threonine protein kinase